MLHFISAWCENNRCSRYAVENIAYDVVAYQHEERDRVDAVCDDLMQSVS